MRSLNVKPPPPAGSGLHFWAFYAANRAKALGADQQQALDIVLRGLLTGGRRQGAQREARSTVNRVYGEICMPTTKMHIQAPSGPDRDRIQQITTASDRYGLADLWEASPIRIEDARPSDIVRLLFNDEDLICAARKWNARTQTIAEWGAGLNDCDFIVPNPMRARSGLTKEDRKVSPRTDDNACEKRRYHVAEFDHGTHEDQAAIIAHLATVAPLVMVLTSGGKSLHGWYDIASASERQQERFIELAIELGADTATRSKSQMVRMPQGIRDNGNQQRVYYFNGGNQ